MNIPHDYNAIIHGRAPKSRVELLAWSLREDANYTLRSAANGILLNSGCLKFSSVAQIRQKSLRRHFIAQCAVIIRRNIKQALGTPVILQVDVDHTSALREQFSEGRYRPSRRPSPHDDQ